jgi:transcriptional regulator with XRE-family HTH domain
MGIETEARRQFGQLVRNYRDQMGLNRSRFAKLARVSKRVVVRLEHGIKNPTRHEFVRCINTLIIFKENKKELFSLLRMFSPRKWKNTKQRKTFYRGAMRYR